MKKGLYQTNIDCRRQGVLTGLFVIEKIKVEELFKHNFEIYFGEVLGKHSEVVAILKEDSLKFITDNPEVIKIIEDYGLQTGINPFDYSILNGKEGEEDLSVNQIIENILNNK